MQNLELNSYDQMMRLRPPLVMDSRLLVVEITEDDIVSQAQWPLSDQTIAQLLKTLQAHRPSVIGLDLYRDVPHLPGEIALCQELQQSNVITIYQLNQAGSHAIPPPPCSSSTQIGFNDFVIDPDNILRRNFMYAELGSRSFHSFSLRMGLYYLAQRAIELKITSDALILGDQVIPRLAADAGGYQIDPSQAVGWQTLLNFRAARDVAQIVTLQDVLMDRVDSDLIRNKIILVGTTAPTKKDLFATPFTTGKATANPEKAYFMPGVLVHANMVSQLLSIALEHQYQWWFLPQGLEFLWIGLWAFIGGGLVWRLHHPLSIALVLALMIGGLWGFSYGLFLEFVWIPVIPPVFALLVTGSSMLASKSLYGMYHDPLTGLPNRRRFSQLVFRAGRSSQGNAPLMGVLCLDLDRFRIINDSLGHAVGDRLLVHLSRQLKSLLSPKDYLARVGGDEFAICIGALRDRSAMNILADKIQQTLSQPLAEESQEIFLTASIGVALSKPQHALESSDLLRDAYSAMYRAKALNQHRPEIFLAPMRAQSQARLALENDLRKAIEHQEFQLYYQPIIFLKTGMIAGVEALVRWQSPQRGFVYPGKFISVTEEMGLIVPLGQWILEEACRQLSQWHQAFPQQPPLMMSVNLSSRQLSQPDLIEKIQHTLEKFQFFRQSLKLEITESMVMNDVETAITLLYQLKALGLKLSIDDFGTGYSSFSLLHRFPMDTLKIDQSFIRHMEEDAQYEEIVRTIITLGHNLGMDIIAEGIETQHQRQKLRSLDCEYGQGYCFAKPLPPSEVTLLLQKRPQW